MLVLYVCCREDSFVLFCLTFSSFLFISGYLGCKINVSSFKKIRHTYKRVEMIMVTFVADRALTFNFHSFVTLKHEHIDVPFYLKWIT